MRTLFEIVQESIGRFISDGSVFSYSGKYLGILDDGFFRDRYGHAVAFMQGAIGGPILPLAELPPLPPLFPLAPLPPLPPLSSTGCTAFAKLVRL